MCSWLHPCPFLGISSPWQGSPSIARKTPDARASDTWNCRGHSAGIRPQAGSASCLPLPSHPIPGWGDLTLSPMPFVASSFVSWEGCPRWREGDCVGWGRGGSLLWCCLAYLWPLRAPAWIPSIWHQRPPSLGGLQPCPQQCVWKAEASTPAVTSCSCVIRQGPYTIFRWRLSFPRESCGSTCFIGAVTFSRGCAGCLSKELSAVRPSLPDYHPRSGRARSPSRRCPPHLFTPLPQPWQTPAGLRVSQAQRGWVTCPRFPARPALEAWCCVRPPGLPEYATPPATVPWR